MTRTIIDNRSLHTSLNLHHSERITKYADIWHDDSTCHVRNNRNSFTETEIEYRSSTTFSGLNNAELLGCTWPSSMFQVHVSSTLLWVYRYSYLARLPDVEAESKTQSTELSFCSQSGRSWTFKHTNTYSFLPIKEGHTQIQTHPHNQFSSPSTIEYVTRKHMTRNSLKRRSIIWGPLFESCVSAEWRVLESYIPWVVVNKMKGNKCLALTLKRTKRSHTNYIQWDFFIIFNQANC